MWEVLIIAVFLYNKSFAQLSREKHQKRKGYEKLVEFNKIIGEMQPHTAIKSKIFISISGKRIDDLLPEECNDVEFFDYNGAEWILKYITGGYKKI